MNEPQYTNLPATHAKGKIIGGIEAYKEAKELEKLIGELKQIARQEYNAASQLTGPYMERMSNYHATEGHIAAMQARFDNLMYQFGPLWFTVD